jgi:hypothetical protein
MNLNVRVACLIGIVTVLQISGQPRSVSLRMPYGEANPLFSPDGAYALFGSDAALYQLWIEDRHTHKRQMVLRATLQTLTLAWSPDSTAFIANDRATSDVEIAWVYEASTLHRLNLRSLIVAADPESTRFIVPGQINGIPPEEPNAKIPMISEFDTPDWPTSIIRSGPPMY